MVYDKPIMYIKAKGSLAIVDSFQVMALRSKHIFELTLIFLALELR